MFCKRCDAAYHCYCMQPPLKVDYRVLLFPFCIIIKLDCTYCFRDVQKVSSGPYLCPKHTKCHSCCSNVPGNGLRARYVVWGHEQLVEILLDSSFAVNIN